ncbi:1-aminocyclopropane-1-carboxylate oxidase homolog 12-like [Syzygium oleosum]|uniref:1-aminocyclopropane-1-carboxylate oxidase homolog 12-like n=1 Tax=Syzygium oleosum TaxID=219896 RepID=UPI0011D253CA|nr:1-aminocyclopropane-1-carboxylate oxidase homolog 12-like [Syzygium oleosum]
MRTYAPQKEGCRFNPREEPFPQLKLKSFDNSKAGVKGLADTKLTHITQIFVHHQLKLEHDHASEALGSSLRIPVIDFGGVGRTRRSPGERKQMVDLVREVCERRGFFQAVNHGMLAALMEEMVRGIRRFHEQDLEAKRERYSRNYGVRKVLDNSNFDLYRALAANWRDSITCVLAPRCPDPQELSAVCRDVIIEYKDRI